MRLKPYVLLVIFLSFSVLTSPPQTSFIPEVKAQSEGNISFQPNVIPFTTVYREVNKTSNIEGSGERFRFLRDNPQDSDARQKRFDIELFFNATLRKWFPQPKPEHWENITKLWSLNDFKADFGCTVTFVKNKNQSMVQWGIIVDNPDLTNEWTYGAWMRIEDTYPYSTNDIQLETVKPNPPIQNFTIKRFHLPDNLVLSFEDLFYKGFMVDADNQTHVVVMGFEGKTHLNLDPIIFSSGIITVTGYTEMSPATFTSLYDADKAGTLTLDSSATRTTNARWSLETQIQPADSLALKPNVVVTAITGSMTIQFNGTDKDAGVNQLETLTLSAIQTYTTTKWFRTIYSDGITLSGVNVGESITFSVTLSRWGVVWNDENYFAIEANLDVGDGSTETWFADTNKQVHFRGGELLVYENAHFRLGEILNEADKTASGGVSLNFYDKMVGCYSGSFVEIYSSVLYGGMTGYFASEGTLTIWNSILQQAEYEFIAGEIFNTIFSHVLKVNLAGSVTFNRVSVLEATEYLIRGIDAITIRNFYGRRCTGTASFLLYLDSYLINTDVDAWTFNWVGGIVYNVYRQYEFDLFATYPNGTFMENANVTISNAVEGKISSFLTFANGSIPTQTLTMRKYDSSGFVDYNPYNITAVSADGQYIYYKSWNVTDMIKWEIALLPLLKYDPVARFTFTPSNPQPNEAITFNGTTSTDIDGTISSYSWNFGDGSSSTASSLSYSYSADNTYTATLTVADNDGNTNSFSQPIVVETSLSGTTNTGGAGNPPYVPTILLKPEVNMTDISMTIKDVPRLVTYQPWNPTFTSTFQFKNTGTQTATLTVTFLLSNQTAYTYWCENKTLTILPSSTTTLPVTVPTPNVDAPIYLWVQYVSPKTTSPMYVNMQAQSFQSWATVPFIIGIVGLVAVSTSGYGIQIQRKNNRKNRDRFKERKKNPWEP